MILDRLLGVGWLKVFIPLAIVVTIISSLILWHKSEVNEAVEEDRKNTTIQTHINEQAEIKADENIKQHTADKPISDVVDSLQSECRDCDEQGIRVQSPSNHQIVPQGQLDAGYGTSNRHTESDTQTPLQCTHKQMSECEPKYCCEL